MRFRFVRAGVRFAAMAGLALVSLGGPAQANPSSENYVATNATLAINALSAAGSPKERSAKFGVLMEQFADVPAIARSVLGRTYAQKLDANPALKAQWIEVFRDYAMASYETQLDRYRGSALRVTGSRDSAPNGRPCSAVSTEMIRKDAEPLRINWYLCQPANGGGWKVADVGLILGDSEMKLAITQRAQFEAVLNSNGGNIQDLIERVKTLTANMRARIGGRKA